MGRLGRVNSGRHVGEVVLLAARQLKERETQYDAHWRAVNASEYMHPSSHGRGMCRRRKPTPGVKVQVTHRSE